MPHEVHAKVLEVLGSQLRQYSLVDRIVAECLLVLLQPETVEPGRDIHARLPAALAYLTTNCRGAGMLIETCRRRGSRDVTRREPW
jgi:hypothetical protein